MTRLASKFFWLVFAAGMSGAVLALSSPVSAVGIQPETSVVLVRESEGEGIMNVTNTGDETVLLVSTVENIQEDSEDWIIVSPPAAVVAPGQTQMVRFILSLEQPLKAQRMKRAIFEGIPQTKEKGNTVLLTVRQDLPLIALPKGETTEKAPWTELQWSTADGALILTNDSPYIVRMDQRIQLMPDEEQMVLPKPYILPGEVIIVREESVDLGRAEAIRLYPATVYGYQVPHFDAPVRH